MAMLSPSEPEKQLIIDKIHKMNPTPEQIERVCRVVLEEHPNDVYPQRSTTFQALSAIVDRSVQKGVTSKLIEEFEVSIHQNGNKSSGIRPIDTDLANQFGKVFTSLLQALEQMDDAELEQYTADIDSADMTEFKDKLENKAKFSKDRQEHAMRSRTEISVLQRLAKKLGYRKYNNLKKKVMFLYFRICDNYPVSQYTADFRFERLLEHLYAQLPPQIREYYDECLEQITGVIFDTTYDCYIFNE
ncbi:hypothetical protein U9M73_11505 [Paenibacillus phoenicis]|uniref:Uncharacterized protein n=1 Tax=Paenibacillus phoenicis TaxID=554117 RepID=A0ABU5PL49_9BACL|nr:MULTISPECIES: hypothetical protein [Paenibacillus]MEA3570624.1 hypothetical protein [Paenibacillus phoenicis]